MHKLLNLIKNNPFTFWFVVLVFVHVFLMNINAVEWGDSYRILRASRYVRDFSSYPTDEKRPPLYSVLLATWPENADPVLWGRGIMLVVSMLSFAAFYFLTKKLLEGSEFFGQHYIYHLSLMLYVFNPVNLYWSLRIMADSFFALIVMVTFLLFYKYKSTKSLKLAFVLGLSAGMAVLTRFEGYLLYFALIIGLVVDDVHQLNPRILFRSIRESFWFLCAYICGFVVVLGPYLILKNPFASSYLSEPSGRAYDVKMILIYLVSLLFVYGLTSGFAFIIRSKTLILNFLLKHLSISAFLGLELLLILMWPAAIPRLFVAVVPFLVILVSLAIAKFFSSTSRDNKFLALNVLLLILFVAGQFYLRLQFLVLNKKLFALVVLVNMFLILASYFKQYRSTLVFMCISTVLWSFSTVLLHKDIYRVVSEAGEFTGSTLCGVIVHNDLTSVIDWNVSYLHSSPCGSTVYYPAIDSGDIKFEDLKKFSAKYLVVTNEHNTTMEFDIAKYPYLKLIKEYSRDINGAHFATKVLEFQGYEAK